MNKEKIENTIALKYQAIQELKKIKKDIEDSDSEDIRFKIETRHWWGYPEPCLGRKKHKINISKYTACKIVEEAIEKARESIDKLIDFRVLEETKDGNKQ